MRIQGFPQDRSPPANKSSACANGGCLSSEKVLLGCSPSEISPFLVGKQYFAQPKAEPKKGHHFLHLAIASQVGSSCYRNCSHLAMTEKITFSRNSIKCIASQANNSFSLQVDRWLPLSVFL